MTTNAMTYEELEAELARAQLALEQTEAAMGRLRRACEQDPMFFCTLRGPALVFDFYNRAYHELVGYRDIQDRPLHEALPEVVAQGFVALLLNIYASGTPFEARELPVQVERGGQLETLYVTFVYHPVFGPDGAVEAILATGSDVTAEVEARRDASQRTEQLQQHAALVEAQVIERTQELQAANEALSAQAEELWVQQEAILAAESERVRFWNLTLDLMNVSNMEGYILRANPAWTRLLGWSEAELTAVPFFDFVHPEDHALVAAELAKLKQGETIFQFECRMRARSGAYFLVDWTAQPEGDAFYVLGRDVTERKAAELESRRQKVLAESIIKHAPAGIAYVNEQLVYEWANPKIHDFWGYPDGHAIGRSVPELFGLDEDAEVVRLLRGVLATGTPFYAHDFEFSYKLDGLERVTYWDFTYQPLVDEGGKVVGIVILALEVSERKRGLDLLGLQNRVLQTIATGLPLQEVLDGLVKLVEQHATGTLCSVLLLDGEQLRHGAAPSLPTAYCEQIEGLVIGPLVGSCGAAAFTKETVVVTDVMADPRWAPFSALAAAHGLRACWSVPILGADGEVLATFAQYHRVPRGPDPQELELLQGAAHLAGIAIERQRVSAALDHHLEELTEANARLHQADRYKDEFLSVISHELRTPLNFIMGFASIVDDEVQGPLNEGQHAAMGKILNGVDRMLLLVDDLLDFARLQAGKFSLAHRPVDYVQLVGDVLATLQPLAEQKGVGLHAELEVDARPEMDPARMVQVLTNLVTNGIKFTPTGGTVAVRASVQAGKLVTEVSDTGIGIAPEDLPKVFNKFEQLDMGNTRQVGGVGLGLSISQMLVDAHHGTIEVLSEPGQGSTFRVTLPLAPRPAAPGGTL